jgi:hypothetical protein
MLVLKRSMRSLALGLFVLAVTAGSVLAQGAPKAPAEEGTAASDGRRSSEVESTTPRDSSAAAREGEDAPDDQEIVQKRKLPILKGHRFIPTSTVPDPFITSYLRSNTGFGLLLDANIPVLTEADTVAVLQGDIAFAVLGFEYQQAIVDFLALRIGFGGAVRTGTNSETLIAEGLSANYSFAFGVTGRVLRTENFLLSAVADFGSNKIIGVDPFGWAERVTAECGDLPSEEIAECILSTEEALLVSGRSNAITGGARGAWSPATWFGLRGRVEFGAGDAFDPEADLGTTIVNLGAVADIDLLEVTPVPIGFLLGYDAELFGSRGSDIAESTTRFNLGLFYTGRKEFSVGVETLWGRVNLTQSEDNVDSVTFNLRLRYFF